MGVTWMDLNQLNWQLTAAQEGTASKSSNPAAKLFHVAESDWFKKIEEIPTDSWLSWKRERKSFAKLHFRVFRFHSLLWSCSILEEMWNLGIKIGQKHWILNKCMNFFGKQKIYNFAHTAVLLVLYGVTSVWSQKLGQILCVYRRAHRLHAALLATANDVVFPNWSSEEKWLSLMDVL